MTECPMRVITALAVAGEGLIPADVTTVAGIEPTFTMEPEENTATRLGVIPRGTWECEYEGVSLDDTLNDLLDVVEPRIAQIAPLRAQHEVGIYARIIFDSTHWAILSTTLSADTLGRLSSIGLPLEIRIFAHPTFDESDQGGFGGGSTRI